MADPKSEYIPLHDEKLDEEPGPSEIKEKTTDKSNAFPWNQLMDCAMWNCPLDGVKGEEAGAECQICLDSVPASTLLPCRVCGQKACIVCLFRVLSSRHINNVWDLTKDATCSFCRSPIDKYAVAQLTLIHRAHAGQISFPIIDRTREGVEGSGEEWRTRGVQVGESLSRYLMDASRARQSLMESTFDDSTDPGQVGIQLDSTQSLGLEAGSSVASGSEETITLNGAGKKTTYVDIGGVLIRDSLSVIRSRFSKNRKNGIDRQGHRLRAINDEQKDEEGTEGTEIDGHNLTNNDYLNSFHDTFSLVHPPSHPLDSRDFFPPSSSDPTERALSIEDISSRSHTYFETMKEESGGKQGDSLTVQEIMTLITPPSRDSYEGSTAVRIASRDVSEYLRPDLQDNATLRTAGTQAQSEYIEGSLRITEMEGRNETMKDETTTVGSTMELWVEGPRERARRRVQLASEAVDESLVRIAEQNCLPSSVLRRFYVLRSLSVHGIRDPPSTRADFSISIPNSDEMKTAVYPSHSAPTSLPLP